MTAFAQDLAGLHLIHQFAQHATGRMSEYEGHQAVQYHNNRNQHQREGNLDSEPKVLEIGFVRIVQMPGQKGRFFHSVIITDFAMRDKSQICDAGQHGIAGQFGGLTV